MTKTAVYLLSILLLGSALTNCVTHNRLQAERLAHQTTRTDLAQLRERIAEDARLAAIAHRAAERTHADELTAIAQRSAHEKQVLVAAAARLARILQDRPDRQPATGDSAVPQGTAGQLACTGAQLYRQDGEFLAGEAARAESIRLQIAECQARYDSAVKLTGGN